MRRKRGHTKEQRKEAIRQLGPPRCWWRGCKESEALGGRIELHHIKPISHGGSDDVKNKMWLCYSHHLEEHGKMNWKDMKYTGVKQEQSAEETKSALIKANPSAKGLKAMSATNIRKYVLIKCFSKGKPNKLVTAETQTFIVNGTTITVAPGSTIVMA